MSYIVDCTQLPNAITDFAFDHLRDDITEDEQLTIDYDQQTVTVESDTEHLAETVRTQLQERCNEKIQDMMSEAKRGYNTELSESELNILSSSVYDDSTITIQEQ